MVLCLPTCSPNYHDVLMNKTAYSEGKRMYLLASTEVMHIMREDDTCAIGYTSPSISEQPYASDYL